MHDYKKTHARETFGDGYYYGSNSDRRRDEFRAELDQMILVAEAGNGGGYDWDVFYAYYHIGRRRYYYIGGSGCSCNYISDGVDSLGDFQDADTQDEVIRAFKREKIEDGYGWSQNDLVSFTNEVKSFRE